MNNKTYLLKHNPLSNALHVDITFNYAIYIPTSIKHIHGITIFTNDARDKNVVVRIHD